MENFEIIKVIGRGSYAKVYLVRRKELDKYFALKVLKKKALFEKNQVA